MKRFLKGVLRAPHHVWNWLLGSTLSQAAHFAWRPHNQELANAALEVTRRITSDGVLLKSQPHEVAEPVVAGLIRNSRIFYIFGLAFVFWSIFTVWQGVPWWQSLGTALWGAGSMTWGIRTAWAAHSIRSGSKRSLSDPGVWFI